jgi:hypothetical protein
MDTEGVKTTYFIVVVGAESKGLFFSSLEWGLRICCAKGLVEPRQQVFKWIPFQPLFSHFVLQIVPSQ